MKLVPQHKMSKQHIQALDQQGRLQVVSSDVPMEDSVPSSASGKRKVPLKLSKSHEITTTTIRLPPWFYLKLQLIKDPLVKSPISLDNLTVKRYLSAALGQFLGLTGESIPMDILKVEENTAWVRVAREDGSAVLAAVGGWIGGGERDGMVKFRVRASGNWLGALVGNEGVEQIWTG